MVAMTIRPFGRWLRFSLRTLLVLVTLFCVWLAREVRLVQKRKAVLAEIQATNGLFSEAADYGKSASLPFWRHWMGDQHMAELCLPEKYVLEIGQARVEAVKERFPEASMLVQTGPLLDVNRWDELIVGGERLDYDEWRAKQPGP